MPPKVPPEVHRIEEEEETTIGMLCLEELAQQIIHRKETKEVTFNESIVIAAVVGILAASAPPPVKKYSAMELVPLMTSQEDCTLIIDQSKEKLGEYLQSLFSSSSSMKKKGPNRTKYRPDQPFWDFSQLRDMGLSSHTLDSLSEEVKIGKTAASPVKEKRPRDDDPVSPKRKPQADPKARTPMSTKKDKVDISGMQSMLSRFVVKKKIESKTTEDTFWWPYAEKTDASYVIQHLDVINGRGASDGEYRYQCDRDCISTIQVTPPSLSIASPDNQLPHDDVCASLKTQISSHSTNMFHPLVSKGGPPVELIAYKDISSTTVQFVGSSPDPTPKIVAVWPVGAPVPRDDETVDYGETFSEAADDDSCSGSSLSKDEISQESGSVNSSMIESESDVDDAGITTDISSNSITISGPAKATPVRSMVSISDESCDRLVPAFFNTALSKIIRLPSNDYAYHTYADWMSNHRMRCTGIPDHIAMNEPVFFEIPDTAQGAGLKEAHKQRSIWDGPSTAELVKLLHYSTHKIPYLVDSFREKYPSFTKSAVGNKLREISHREGKYWIVREHLIDHLGLAKELEDRKPLEPEHAPVKRPKKTSSPKSKVSTRSQSMLAKFEKRTAEKKKKGSKGE